MRKMLVAMADDLRVLIIKLADRLHNMRTIGGDAAEPSRSASPRRRSTSTPRWRTASACRSSSSSSRTSSFAALHPKRYAEIDHMVADPRARARRVPGRRCSTEVREAGSPSCGIDAEVTGRPKHLWTIYEKMVVKGKRVRRDLRPHRHPRHRRLGEGLLRRAGLASTPRWKPVQGRFKDYIAMPKFNLYQSLHTTVIGPQRQAARGADPHPGDAPAGRAGRRRPLGVQGRASRPATSPGCNRHHRLAAETSDPGAVHGRALKIDLEQDEVFVLHAEGQGRHAAASGRRRSTSPTPIHTEVGHACIGARVNGRLVPLDSKLRRGDTVEIFTSKVEGGGPVAATG